VLNAVCAAVTLPITLKYRAGWNEQHLNFLDTAQIAEQAGIAALALHPRTREQRYTGVADWSRIAAVKRAVSIPVVGSGDVKDAADALQRLETSGVDGVMIGRAAMSNPWIFLQVEQLRRGEPLFAPTPADKYGLLLRFLSMCLAELPDRIALNHLKQLIGHFFIGLPGSAVLRTCIQRSKTSSEAREWLDTFFAQYVAEYEMAEARLRAEARSMQECA
jgi:tRNA-dihydrouridine synthase